MTNSIPANVHINQDGTYALYKDEVEIFSMLKNMYKDYWRTKDDGEPRIEESEGNYWQIEYRVHRMDNGEPNIDKKIYFKSDKGEKIRVKDRVDEEEGTLPWVLERTRNVIEKTAFLASAYEAHERYLGDVARLIDATQDIDIRLHDASIAGKIGRETMASVISDINEGREKVEIVNWTITSPELENELGSEDELKRSQLSGEKLILPPMDGGYPRFEEPETAVDLDSLREPLNITKPIQENPHGLIWGDENPNRAI